MTELGGMMKVLPWAMVAFVVGSLVSMGMPALSGFVAEFPIFLGVWNGGTMNLSETVLGMNPADYYPIIAILASLGIIITAAYVIRAIGRVFMGNYDGQKWHDMRPLIALDKVALVGFVVILVVIGLFPSVIAPIVESGVSPVVDRLQDAQEAQTAGVIENVYTAASSFIQSLGGA